MHENNSLRSDALDSVWRKDAMNAISTPKKASSDCSQRRPDALFDTVWKRDVTLTKINPAQCHRRRLVSYFLDKLNINPQTIIDIGCGTGELLKELSRKYPKAKLTGCDLSQESGRLLKELLPESNFICLDVEKHDARFNSSVDLITCSEVIEHCKNPDGLVENAFNWLKPGGIFFVTVPAGQMTGYDITIGHLHHYTKEEVSLLLTSKGFSKVEVKYWGEPFHGLYRYIVGLGSNKIANHKNNSKLHFILIHLLCNIFNFLFYLNPMKDKGLQILAWGIKETDQETASDKSSKKN